jgi:predicted TIM-barrel fold metal-dependent hydrolase
MPDDTLVIDAVVHPFDLSPENLEISLDTASPLMYTKDMEYMITKEEQLQDFPMWAAAHALFAESQADLGVLHALPRFAFTKVSLSPLSKMVAMRDRWPNRFLLYGTIDTTDVNEAIASLERQVNELKIDGLKMYPVIRYDGGMRGWKMDEEEYAFPILEAARDLGIKNVAIHKAIPVGQRLEYFRMPDLEAALAGFPEINFHVVHAGYAFLEEFTILFELYQNLYANLENTSGFAVVRPRLFAEILGEMLYWGSAERICFASGITVMHPRPGLDALFAFEMPHDLIEGKGYPEVTDEMKRLIAGGNMARVHGLDTATVRAGFAGDEFELAKQDGLRMPWSGLRENAEPVTV